MMRTWQTFFDKQLTAAMLLMALPGVSPPLHSIPSARKLPESCDTPLKMLGLAQIQSDEHVHLDLLGQTLDGHDLDLLRIGTFMQCLASNQVQTQGWLGRSDARSRYMAVRCPGHLWKGVQHLLNFWYLCLHRPVLLSRPVNF